MLGALKLGSWRPGPLRIGGSVLPSWEDIPFLFLLVPLALSSCRSLGVGILCGKGRALAWK